MPPSGDLGWMDRVAESLSEHEERRESLQDTPPRYEILGEISRGGMGIVYRAWDPVLGREVALKVLSEGTAEAHERFRREAELAARLHHASIVAVHDYGLWHDRDYIALQLIDGTTLASAKLDLRAALAAVRDAARALHYAHEEKIVHRDIKPSNLLLDRQGRVFVTDFGVARQLHVGANLTNPGCVVGTPAYMSPEQAQGLTDARSDVYSLGATLYELATGRPPYSGNDPVRVVETVRAEPPPPPRSLQPELSKNVESIILGAMERRPEDRYATAAELADDIDRYLSGERPLRRPRGTTYKVRRQFARHPWKSTAVIVFCALLVMAGILLGYWIRGQVYWSRAQKETDPLRLKSQLKIAATWVPAAEKRLAELQDQELAVRENMAKQAVIDQEKARRQQAEADEQARILKAEKDDAARKADIESRRNAVFVALTTRSLPNVRSALEALRTVAPEKHGELLPRLRELEFDSGIEELERLAMAVDAETFATRYRDLEGPDYLRQRERNLRLARPAMQLALNLADAKRFADALPWYDAADALEFRRTVLYQNRGLARLELEKWDEAQRDYDEFIRFPGSTPDPRFARLPYRRARLALSKERWEEALKECDAALRIDPRLAAALHDRGIARFRASGQAAEAIEQDLQAALALQPELKPGVAYRDIVTAFVRTEVERHWGLDKEEERTAAWTRVARWLTLFLDRSLIDDADLLLDRARMHRRLGDLSLAIQDARKSLEARVSGDGHLTLGILIYLQAARNKDPRGMEEAEDRFRIAMGFPEVASRASYWRGLCLRYRGTATSLDVALLESALPLLRDAQGADAHGTLQLARTRVDLVPKGQDWRGGAEDAARALAAASTMTETEYVGALFELQKVSRKEAIRLLSRDAHLVRGQAGYEGSDYALCIQECKAALALDPNFASAFIWRGYARCRAKQHQEAQADFRETIRLTTHAEEKNSANGWLEQCLRHPKD